MGTNATTDPNVVRGFGLLNGQETVLAIHCGPQATARKSTNN